MKNVSRHQHDKSRYSRIAIVDTCFALFGARQHGVAKICNATPTAIVHKLQNDPFTISRSVLWTYLCPKTSAATSRVSRHKKTKCQCWCLERQKISNVAGKSQPKHSNAWPIPWGLMSQSNLRGFPDPPCLPIPPLGLEIDRCIRVYYLWEWLSLLIV